MDGSYIRLRGLRISTSQLPESIEKPFDSLSANESTRTTKHSRYEYVTSDSFGLAFTTCPVGGVVGDFSPADVLGLCAPLLHFISHGIFRKEKYDHVGEKAAHQEPE
jgi:hypothetical protein